jgi:aminodeoxyfutalosine synthase
MNNLNQILNTTSDKDLKQIANKILNQQRISFEDGVMLFEKGSLAFVGALANYVREQ